MLLLGERAPDHDVDVPGFIFERDEGDALGRARMLTHGDESGAAQAAALIGRISRRACRHDAAARECGPDQGQRMQSQRQALGRVVGHHIFAQ